MHWEEIKTHYEGTRVAVLGATGFIGTWVARQLCSLGAEVYLFHRDAEQAERIYSAYEVKGEPVVVDLLEAGVLERALQDIRPAITFNLAGYGVNPNEKDEQIAQALNVRLVERLVDCLATARDLSWRQAALVHPGSGFEYGAIGGDLNEASVPEPKSLYATTKYKGTTTLLDASHQAGLPAVLARPFTAYGAGEGPHRLLPSLMKGAERGEVIQLSAGVQKRDFIYVEDVAEGLIRLALSTSEPAQIVNLASGALTSVRRFSEIAADALGIAEGLLRFGSISTRVVEMEHLPVNISRLQTQTGWRPPTSIREGVERTQAFFQPHNEAYLKNSSS